MISLFESGKKVPKDNTIKVICVKFHVREDWLRYGTGDMEESTLATITDSDEARLLAMFRKLSATMKKVILEKIQEFLAVDKPLEEPVVGYDKNDTEAEWSEKGVYPNTKGTSSTHHPGYGVEVNSRRA